MITVIEVEGQKIVLETESNKELKKILKETGIVRPKPQNTK
jgi:hypothetical protein